MHLNTRRLFFYLLVVSSVVALTVSHCGGSRHRTADLDVSSEEINQELDVISAMTEQLTNETQVQALNGFFNIWSNGGTLYYARAPSTMGSIPTVMPIFFQDLLEDTTDNKESFSPKDVRAYFAFSNSVEGPRAALLIAGNDGISPNGFEPIPQPGASPTGNTPQFTFMFLAVNDGVATSEGEPLPPGVLGGKDFVIEMNYRNRFSIVARSTDVIEGDLANVIQLQLTILENGQEYSLGKVNLLQP